MNAAALKDLERLLGFAASAGLNTARVRTYARASYARLLNPSDQRIPTELEDRWYESLRNQLSPDFGVYDGEEYVGEAWACWRYYSRKYLDGIGSDAVALGGIKAVLGHPAVAVVDLGCGIGFTTERLAEMFPEAVVTGTQRPESAQFGICRLVSHRKFQICNGIGDAGRADVVFASEYFEHFYRPLIHLREVIEATSPEIVITANAFDTTSVWHFESYSINGHSVSGLRAARGFSSEMRHLGFEKVKTRLWNQRPTIWRRSSAS